MKSLYIVRHAKSSWDYPELSDEERPLLSKGVRRTEKIINYLKEKNTTVDLIISSHAVRAYDTARLIAESINYHEKEIIVRSAIYHADTDTLLQEVFAVDNAIDSVMIVGHNPGFTRFANYFLEEQVDWLPTSGVVKIDFDVERWNDIIDSSRKTDFIVYPKMLV